MTFSQFAGVLVNLSPLTWLIIAAPFVAYYFAGHAAGHISDRHAIDWKTRRLFRRWYCRGAYVYAAGAIRQVEAWEEYEDGSIWLRVASTSSPCTFIWVSLAKAAPFEIPAFRPHLDHGFPRLTRYIPAGAA